MNILIFGDANSIFMKDFCKHVLKKEDNVCIVSYTDTKSSLEFYQKMCIKEIYIRPYIEDCSIHLDNIISILIKRKKEIKKVLPFQKIDVIHVHYVEPSVLLQLFFIWISAKKRILTFWGSDILRISRENKKLLRPFLSMASSITFMIPAQYNAFCDIYGNYYKKVQIVDMGDEIIDIIEDVQTKYSRNSCKKCFGMATNKITIHIGYNKSKEQQHLKLVEQICLLPRTISSKIQIVFPWAYGGENTTEEDEYILQLKQLLKQKEIDYMFVNEFLTGEKLAMFRSSCDIFLYAQTTDARSASTIEYVYAGSLFICPSWVWDNYSIINHVQNICVRYCDISEVKNILYRNISKGDYANSNDNQELRKIIYKNISWKYLAVQWRNLY